MDLNKGFTLLELLVAIGIIGILASLAIIQYVTYKQRAFDARALSDMRNAMSAQEAYFATHETFKDSLSQLEGFDTASPSVTVVLDNFGDRWEGSSYHPQGSKTFCYDSDTTEILELEGIARRCS